MLLIIAGLYCFLWGKSKESKNTTRPKVAVVEASVVVPDKSAALQASAVLLPSASPIEDCGSGGRSPTEIVQV